MLASRVPLLVAGVALVGQGVYAQNVQCDYLGSDVEASSAQVGWESYHVDFTPAERGPGQSGILLDGVQYKKGIFAHAPSNVVFSLDGAYQTVSGCAGIATLEDCGTPMRASPGSQRMMGVFLSAPFILTPSPSLQGQESTGTTIMATQHSVF